MGRHDVGFSQTLGLIVGASEWLREERCENGSREEFDQSVSWCAGQTVGRGGSASSYEEPHRNGFRVERNQCGLTCAERTVDAKD